MCFICILSFVLLIFVVFVLVVFVQDSSSIDIVLGKYFVVVGGILLLELKNDLIFGVKKIDGGLVLIVSFSYYINDNWVVELWGVVDKFDNKFKGLNNVCLGLVEQQLVVLSGQYYFGQVDNVFCLFVGVGYYQLSFSNEKLGNGVDIDICFKDVKGVIGIVGVDMNINFIWFVCVDVCYMCVCLDIKVGGEKIGEVKMDLWIVGFGIGVCF